MWAPRYRQAAIGAFLTTKPEGQQALDAANTDLGTLTLNNSGADAFILNASTTDQRRSPPRRKRGRGCGGRRGFRGATDAQALFLAKLIAANAANNKT